MNTISDFYIRELGVLGMSIFSLPTKHPIEGEKNIGKNIYLSIISLPWFYKFPIFGWLFFFFILGKLTKHGRFNVAFPGWRLIKKLINTLVVLSYFDNENDV